mgnify:CR=1 FL=1
MLNLNPNLNNLVCPRERNIYVGPRISCAAEARWQGNLHELQVGMLVATCEELRAEAMGTTEYPPKV